LDSTGRCACGTKARRDVGPVKVGWRPDGCGGALLLVTCLDCSAQVPIAHVTDASFCTICRRVLYDEVKVATERDGVLCVACARRTHAVPVASRTARAYGSGLVRRSPAPRTRFA